MEVTQPLPTPMLHEISKNFYKSGLLKVLYKNGII